MNWIALTGETKDVVRDQNGVPIEWTILRLGENPICQEGRDGTIRLTAEGMRQILAYHTKKGEEIPIDSEHYLYELANQKKLDEGETLKLFPGGVAAMGFGSLALSGENLRIRVKWNPAGSQKSILSDKSDKTVKCGSPGTVFSIFNRIMDGAIIEGEVVQHIPGRYLSSAVIPNRELKTVLQNHRVHFALAESQ